MPATPLLRFRRRRKALACARRHEQPLSPGAGQPRPGLALEPAPLLCHGRLSCPAAVGSDQECMHIFEHTDDSLFLSYHGGPVAGRAQLTGAVARAPPSRPTQLPGMIVTGDSRRGRTRPELHLPRVAAPRSAEAVVIRIAGARHGDVDHRCREIRWRNTPLLLDAMAVRARRVDGDPRPQGEAVFVGARAALPIPGFPDRRGVVPIVHGDGLSFQCGQSGPDPGPAVQRGIVADARVARRGRSTCNRASMSRPNCNWTRRSARTWRPAIISTTAPAGTGSATRSARATITPMARRDGTRGRMWPTGSAAVQGKPVDAVALSLTAFGCTRRPRVERPCLRPTRPRAAASRPSTRSAITLSSANCASEKAALPPRN